MKFDVLNRFSLEVQFTAEIESAEDWPRPVKLGLAVRWAVKNDADLIGANLIGANLSGANLSGAHLRDADLIGANLSGAHLRDANLIGANLIGANLSGAHLIGANLRDANLSGADLIGANLSGANLSGANLIGANLSGAHLIGANLSGANLSGAHLRDANLSGADLLCCGNMREVKTLQFDNWQIGYTAEDLQIGCQKHPIDKWRKWDTPAGREWINTMDDVALVWAVKYMPLVLAIIDASPATPAGKEAE